MRCVWLSDHAPLQEQVEYLNQRGYEVCWLTSPHPQRWQSGGQAFGEMTAKFGIPDIIVMILPADIVGEVFLKLAGDIPVYQPDMQVLGTNRWSWTGKWKRITGTKYRVYFTDIPDAKETICDTN